MAEASRPAPPRPQPAPGLPQVRVAGRYTLLEPLGEGGTSAVYRARDETSGRELAFKQLQSLESGRRRKLLEALFEREYHTLIRLKHPRIIEVYDYGLTDSGPFYTMELLAGEDLNRLSPLPYPQVCAHLRDLASSLALIHAHRLLHRDITPRNVRLTPDGRPKLIDFGALTGFGVAKELVGTPAYSPPEVPRGMPLDQRTDLYALGAVGYFALTGRHAFATQHFDVLYELWKRPVTPPSKLVADIPPELDSLIVSLLSADPLARPSSAALVIDRLTAIGSLPAEDHELAADSYLSSGRMVGRERELEWSRERIARALTGQGASIVLEGASGVGKTRLLHEVGLEAQLRGITVLKADAEAALGTFGLATELSHKLLAACPELARRAAEPYAPLLGHLDAELHEKLGSPALAALPNLVIERRARLQQALHEWFLTVARARPLLLGADNVQVADELSASFLAALSGEARRAQLLVISLQRSGEEPVAPAAVHALHKRGSRLLLSGLEFDACEDFVRSLFGEVANCGRVARHLFDKSAGNPQLCMDLAHLLVQRKIARYVGGAWVLPQHVSPSELPSRMDEIVAGRLEDLSGNARELAEALSVYSGPVSIAGCLDASRRIQGAAALNALDELVASQILLIEGERYRFAQPKFAAAMLAKLDATRRRELHLRAAETLLAADGAGLATRVDAAWQYMHGGAERRGADLLANTTLAFLKQQFVTESVDQLVLALRSAVDVYERQKRNDYELAALLFPLVPLGYYGSDHRVVTRYALRAFRIGLRITGLGLAQWLAPMLGKRAALRVSRFVARVRAAIVRRTGASFDVRGSTSALSAMMPATLGTVCTCVDVTAADEVWSALAPLDLLDQDPFVSLMRAWGKAQLLTVVGRERESLDAFSTISSRLNEAETAAVLGESHRRTMYGGSLFSRALLECHCSSPRALEIAREMDGLGLRFWQLTADQVRRLYHAYRGESEIARVCQERVELFATQGYTTWQSEMFWPAVLLEAELMCADTIATRHHWEQLERRARDVPSLRPFAGAAHAAYLTLRGELDAAIALYEQVLPAMPPRRLMSWLTTRSGFARVLNLARQHARAKRVVEDALAELTPEDDVVAMHASEARRQLALAESGLGDHARAIEIVDGLFVKYGWLDNPLLLGLFHKARAEIAIGMADRLAFEQHLAGMERWFRATGNPALIAQYEQLAERAVRSRLRRSLDPVDRRSLDPSGRQHVIAALAASTNRAASALRMILERSHSTLGSLYLVANGELQLAAATTDGQPDAAREELEARLARLMIEDEGPTVAMTIEPRARPSYDPHEPIKTVFIHSDSPANLNARRLVALTTVRDGRRIVVGGAIVETTSQDLFRLDYEFLATIADALWEARATA
jgi:hypothetical protein